MTECAIAMALGMVLSAVELWRLPQGGSISFGFLPILFVAYRRGVGAGVISGVLLGLLQLLFAPSIVHPIQAVLDYPVAYGLLGLAGLTRDYKTSIKMVTIINGTVAVGLLLLLVLGRLDYNLFKENLGYYYEFLELRLAIALFVVALFTILEQLKGNPVVLGVLIGGCARLFAHVVAGVVFFSSYAPQSMNPWVYSFIYNISHVLPELIVACLILPAILRRSGRLRGTIGT
jgi:energy-coupled thiamine transporter ThiT